MPVTATELVSTADTTGGTSSVSGSFTPTANTPVVVVVTAMTTVEASPTMTGNGLTYTLRKTQLWGASDVNAIYLFDSPGAGTPSAGGVTFNVPGDASAGTVIQVYEFAGAAPGAAAFVQRVSKQNPTPGSATNPTSDYAATRTNTLIFTAVGLLSNPTGKSVDTANWTEGTDAGFATPTTGQRSAWRGAGASITSITWDGGSSFAQWGTVGVEITPPSGGLTTLGVG